MKARLRTRPLFFPNQTWVDQLITKPSLIEVCRYRDSQMLDLLFHRSYIFSAIYAK